MTLSILSPLWVIIAILSISLCILTPTRKFSWLTPNLTRIIGTGLIFYFIAVTQSMCSDATTDSEDFQFLASIVLIFLILSVLGFIQLKEEMKSPIT